MLQPVCYYSAIANAAEQSRMLQTEYSLTEHYRQQTSERTQQVLNVIGQQTLLTTELRLQATVAHQTHKVYTNKNRMLNPDHNQQHPISEPNTTEKELNDVKHYRNSQITLSLLMLLYALKTLLLIGWLSTTFNQPKAQKTNEFYSRYLSGTRQTKCILPHS